MISISRLRYRLAVFAALMGASLLISFLWPALAAGPAAEALAAGAPAPNPMVLRVTSLACAGQTVTTTFQVSNLPRASQVTDYGSVSYVVNGQTRTASFQSRRSDAAIYADTETLAQAASSLPWDITGASAAIDTNSGVVTLILANPGSYTVSCTAAATATPTETLTPTQTPTPTDTPTPTSTSTPTMTPTATSTSVPTDTATSVPTLAATATSAPTDTPTPQATETAVPTLVPATGTPPGAAGIGGAGVAPTTLPETGTSNLTAVALVVLVLGVLFVGAGFVVVRRSFLVKR